MQEDLSQFNFYNFSELRFRNGIFIARTEHNEDESSIFSILFRLECHRFGPFVMMQAGRRRYGRQRRRDIVIVGQSWALANT
jgi:hypothetical protein